MCLGSCASECELHVCICVLGHLVVQFSSRLQGLLTSVALTKQQSTKGKRSCCSDIPCLTAKQSTALDDLRDSVSGEEKGKTSDKQRE